MNLLIQPLGDATPVVEALQDDGWVVVAQPDGTFVASHRDVPDEAAARARLADLDLLTSNAVHIDFQAGSP
jgi:hypothetical protein